MNLHSPRAETLEVGLVMVQLTAKWSAAERVMPATGEQVSNHRVRARGLLASGALEKPQSQSGRAFDLTFGVKMGDDCDCRPLGFLIGLPFMLVGLLLSVIGMVIWLIATVLALCCPCFICCAGIANVALSLIKAPFKIITWFTKQIPC